MDYKEMLVEANAINAEIDLHLGVVEDLRDKLHNLFLTYAASLKQDKQPEPLKPAKREEDKPTPSPLVIWLRDHCKGDVIDRLLAFPVSAGHAILYHLHGYTEVCRVPCNVHIEDAETTLDLAGVDACKAWLNSFDSVPF